MNDSSHGSTVFELNRELDIKTEAGEDLACNSGTMWVELQYDKNSVFIKTPVSNSLHYIIRQRESRDSDELWLSNYTFPHFPVSSAGAVAVLSSLKCWLAPEWQWHVARLILICHIQHIDHRVHTTGIYIQTTNGYMWGFKLWVTPTCYYDLSRVGWHDVDCRTVVPTDIVNSVTIKLEPGLDQIIDTETYIRGDIEEESQVTTDLLPSRRC